MRQRAYWTAEESAKLGLQHGLADDAKWTTEHEQQHKQKLMTRQGGMKQAARDWLNRTDATGNGILNGKNESDVRTGLTSVCQLLYFPISYFFTSPFWCTLSPNSPIEKKEISNDRTRPMKADQGFYSLAKRLYYRSESDAPY